MPTPKIIAGIRRFEQKYQENREFFERLAVQGQSPEVMFIACSDSRVPAELLAQVEPGDLFVCRNVGNIVPPMGTGEMSVGADVEYAILHLGVKHIVVNGHTDCGGIEALDVAVDWSREAHIARWIDHARPAKTSVEARGLPEEDRHLAIVRENVLLQLEHLRTYDAVRTAERAGTLALHGWVYHLETGTFERYDPSSGAWVPVTAEG